MHVLKLAIICFDGEGPSCRQNVINGDQRLCNISSEPWKHPALHVTGCSQSSVPFPAVGPGKVWRA